ncbi:MAG: flagellar basal body L-ring protein FlgH [Nevskiales bacterium]
MFSLHAPRALALVITGAGLLFAGGCASTGGLTGPSAMPAAMPPLAQQEVAYTPDPSKQMLAYNAASAGPGYNSGSIYQAHSSVALFEDRRARRVGDILTIELVERTLAQKSAATSTSKDSNVAMDGPTTLLGEDITRNGLPLFNAEITGSRDFDGAGSSSQSNQLEGTVSVTVAQVFANGSMLVRGEKTLILNQGEERVQISGVVRPEDIDPDNSVPSSRVADVKIVYAGSGALADANTQGWLSRFFNSPYWPF